MKNWILFISVVLAVVMSGLYLRSCNDKRTDQKVASTPPDTAHYWKDAYGHEHARLQEQTMTSAAAQLLIKKKLDSAAKINHIQASNIDRLTTETTTLKIAGTFNKVDTNYYPVQKNSADSTKRIRSLTGSFMSNYFQALVRLGDSSSFWIQAQDTVGTVFHHTGFFTKKNFMDITHKNPYVHTTSIQSQYIQDANGSWQVVIFAGLGYDATSLQLSKPKPIFGIGVAKRIFSFGK